MNTPNDGGAALPHPKEPNYWPGLLLRDWFASTALQGIIANSDPAMLKINSAEAMQRGEKHTAETYSRQAYEYADAMLKAREVKP